MISQVLSVCLALSSCQLSSWSDLVRHSNGALVPADTPAVAAAKAAFHKAAGLNHPVAAVPKANHVNSAVVPDAAAARAARPAARPAQPAARATRPTARVVQPTARPARPASGGAVQPVAAYVRNGLVEHPNGAVVPAEPDELVAAKRAHLQLASVPIAYILEDNLFVYPNGVIVPAEGEANMAARRAHLTALANAA